MGLTGLALAACARSVPVRAPMVAADAVPADASARPGPSPPLAKDGEELPFHRGERLVGTYICTQGKTALAFILDDVHAGADEGIYVSVTFEFQFDGTSNGSTSAEGSAHMKGTFDPKTHRLRLHAEDWIEQPANYSLVDFVGTVGRTGVYSGRVEGPGCTTFTASPDRSDDSP